MKSYWKHYVSLQQKYSLTSKKVFFLLKHISRKEQNVLAKLHEVKRDSIKTQNSFTWAYFSRQLHILELAWFCKYEPIYWNFFKIGFSNFFILRRSCRHKHIFASNLIYMWCFTVIYVRMYIFSIIKISLKFTILFIAR